MQRKIQKNHSEKSSCRFPEKGNGDHLLIIVTWKRSVTYLRATLYPETLYLKAEKENIETNQKKPENKHILKLETICFIYDHKEEKSARCVYGRLITTPAGSGTENNCTASRGSMGKKHVDTNVTKQRND